MNAVPASAIARLRRAVFARHANPWSVWTRWATAPLVLVPVWTRRWSHAAIVATRFAVNPVIFLKPADDRAWASRAMLGEEQWLVERPRDAALGVNAAATVAAVIGVVAARRRRLGPAVAATAVQMALLLVYWALMARYLARHRRRDLPASGAES
ncbi:DUF6653 family protein [Goodfellowiella coeruleoviolacea]|nr:DUF6653 family protein [Goodfellowiella coeruleoviolacea]